MTDQRNTIRRRTLVVGIAGGVTTAVLSAPAIVSAQSSYPNKSVRYINPFPAGGATDTLSRLFCAKLSELSGQHWIVENKGGSGGNVGMEALMQSPPDGYTLGLGGIASHAISPTLYANLLAGQIHMIFDNIPGALAQSRPGKVRALGVTSKERTPVVPDVPAIAETLPGFDINSWTTLTGPAKLPPDVVARLSELSKKALESEDLKAKFLDLAATAVWSSPADTLAYRDSEEARLAPIIKASGARID